MPAKGLAAAEQAGIDIEPPPSDVAPATDGADQSAIDPTSASRDEGLVTWTDAQVRLNSERQFSGGPDTFLGNSRLDEDEQ